MAIKMVGKFWQLLLVAPIIVPLVACNSNPSTTVSTFQITSSAFTSGSQIPSQFTVNGAGTSPPLAWANAPAGTRSFALIMDDPDAPLPGGFTHWVVFNIPADRKSFPENIPASSAQISGGGVQGLNGANKVGYIGPAPPQGTGTHLYRFNLYALDTMLSLDSSATKDALLSAMGTHMLGNALLTGTYSYLPQGSG